MKNIITLACLLTLSSALAAPIMGTKQSVNESSFCKKFKCSLISSGTYNPARNPERFQGYKQYAYKLSGQGVLEIVRNSSMIVESASIKFDGKDAFMFAWNSEGIYTNDFGKSFMGIVPSNSLKDTCLIGFTQDDSPPVSSGQMGTSGKYSMTCLASLAQPSGFPAKTAAIITINLK